MWWIVSLDLHLREWILTSVQESLSNDDNESEVGPRVGQRGWFTSHVFFVFVLSW